MAANTKPKDSEAAPAQSVAQQRRLANLKEREKVLLAKQARLPDLKGDQMDKAAERIIRRLAQVRAKMKELSK